MLLQLVVGHLNTSRLTGRLQLSDETGSIDCAVGAWPSATDESSATDHCCGSSACTVSTSSGHVGACPFIQTSLLGGIYRIDRFQLVVEAFRVANGDTVVCLYIQVAATDLLQLCGRPRQKSSPSLSSAMTSNRSPDSANKENQQKVADVDRNSSTPSAAARQTDCQNDSCADMFASFMDSPSSAAQLVPPNIATGDICRCFISQLFVVDYCQNISLRSRYIEQLSLMFNAIGYFIGPPKLSGCGCPKSAGNSVSGNLPTKRPVAVLFDNRTVRWYSVLHSGCIYKIVFLSGDVSPFLGKFTLPRTKSTKLERHAERSLVVLDKNIHVERISISSPGYRDLMLSPEEDAAVSAAIDEVDIAGRLRLSDEFWRKQSLAASAR